MRIIFLVLLSSVFWLQTVAQEKPNIIFILADDMGYGDLGCYGQQKIKTPNIDKLAKGGMKFTNFYSGSPVCAPSRASLMTGQHTGHVYIRGNGELPLRDIDTVLPQVLHKADYVNGMVGKWGLGLQYSSGVPEKKGWDFFGGYLHHVEGHFQRPDSAWQLINGVSTKVPVPSGTYINEWFKDEALSFIEKNKQQPFFLYVALTIPHAELMAPPKYLQLYLNKDGNSKFAPEIPQPSGLHYGPQPFPKAAYAAMVTQADDYVGQIMDLLKKLKLEKNTLVIFASDNGTHIEGGRTIEDAFNFFHSSGPLRGMKRDLYEGGIRIPFIASWKGKIKAGSTNNYNGAFWDIVPTMIELAGVQPTSGDGISFAPTLLGKPQQSHEFLYWEFYENGFKQAVRKGNWKGVRFYKGEKPAWTELYDLLNDIGERNNLATKYPELVKEMESIMDKEHITAQSSLFQIK